MVPSVAGPGQEAGRGAIAALPLLDVPLALAAKGAVPESESESESEPELRHRNVRQPAGVSPESRTADQFVYDRVPARGPGVFKP